MKVLKSVLIFVFVFVAVNLAGSIDGAIAGDQGIGEQLVRQVWADMKAGNMEALEGYTAPGFQSIHEDGARSRDTELQLIKKLNLGTYTLSNFKVTESGPVITVTYFVSVEETIKGERLSSKPAARLSAWLKTDTGWQWIIHANLKAM